MKIFIASSDDSDVPPSHVVAEFTQRFNVSPDVFVESNPDVIWFLTGGSEHKVLSRIESKNRYCFIASKDKNSWAAATEVKALLNQKGIITKIFDYDKLQNLEELEKFLEKPVRAEHTRVGLIGGISDWLVSSTPEIELIDEVLGFEVVNFSWDDVMALPEGEDFCNYAENFSKFRHPSYEAELSIVKKIDTLRKQNNIDAITVACFHVLQQVGSTICLPVAAMNNVGFTATCEGDLCSAAGMIVIKQLTGIVPWMANLSYVDRGGAVFSHCTVHQNILSSMNITTHFESGKDAAIKGELTKQQVTICRIDDKMEYCFLSLGEVVDNYDNPFACRTQAYVKMSSKSLFLLREFPLGNHHLIIPGDWTDVIAEFFTNHGFRIV